MAVCHHGILCPRKGDGRITYFESVAGQNAVEHIANAIGEIAARMQQQNEILLRIEQRLKEQSNNSVETASVDIPF